MVGLAVGREADIASGSLAWPAPQRSSGFGPGISCLWAVGVPGGQDLLFFAAGEAEWRDAGCGLDLAA
jgi:hypothetical protein